MNKSFIDCVKTPMKIMFIEDDPDQIMVYDYKFKSEGITTILAENRYEVFKNIVDEPKLILLDILLKQENGLDILEWMRKDDRYKDIPVIVFSNYDKQETRDRAKALGAIDYIIKSQTDPVEMAKKIRTFFETGSYTPGVIGM